MLIRHATSARLRLVTSGCAVAWLGLLALPAGAASGVDILCDESDEQSDTLDVHVETLSVDIVNHDDVPGVTPDAPSAAAELSSRAAPLTDLKSSSVRESASEMSESNPSDALTRDDDLPGPSSRFPGVSDDEALRYRSRMYRTDI